MPILVLINVTCTYVWLNTVKWNKLSCEIFILGQMMYGFGDKRIRFKFYIFVGARITTNQKPIYIYIFCKRGTCMSLADEPEGKSRILIKTIL